MSLTHFVQSSGFKQLSSKIYYWSRAIIVLGIIFLINSWPGGAILASVGGFLVILIYFFVAFEPVPDEYDWTLAFPELAGFVSSDDSEEQEEEQILERERLKILKARIERLKDDVEKLS